MSKRLWEVKISTSPQLEEPVLALLARVTNAPSSTYLDLRNNRLQVSAYVRSPKLQRVELTRQLREGFKGLRQSGLDAARTSIAIARLPEQKWAESWRRHFKPLAFGTALLVKPSWSKRRGRPGQATVTLDPGLSFGTGQHPTTAFCLNELVRLRTRAEGRSFLDLGTGSGILAIAAAKLGYSPVDAIDFDPDAIRIARANARVNAVAGGVRFQMADVKKLSGNPKRRYGLICANLIADLLISERARILRRLAPGGALVIAGILAAEFQQVLRVFQADGMRRVQSRREGEWKSATLVPARAFGK